MVKKIGGWEWKKKKGAEEGMLERRWKRKADDSKLRTVYNIQWCCKATKMKITARLQL